MGRPRKYASDAERVAAFRTKKPRLDVPVSEKLDATINDIAAYFEVSRAYVVNSLIRTALTNRDVYKVGLYHWHD